MNNQIITLPKHSHAGTVLHLFSGPKMGFSPRRGDTLPQ